MPQNRRQNQNQAPAPHARAADRYAALQASIGDNQPTRRQQRTLNTLQGRMNQAQGDTQANLGGLNQGQQNIAAGGTDIALRMLESDQFQNPYQAPQTPNRLNDGDIMGLRNDVYNQQYEYLTRDLGQQEAQAGQDVSQSLADRGITYSADPNSRYQQEMRDYNNRFDRARADARAQANQFAGQESQRAFGMNEQVIANILSQGLDQRNQNVNEIGYFTQLAQPGVGLYEGLKDVDAERRARNKIQQQAMSGGGGSSGGGTPGPAYSNPYQGL